MDEDKIRQLENAIKDIEEELDNIKLALFRSHGQNRKSIQNIIRRIKDEQM
jgi:uncharacterized protein (UPF0335 family)